MTEHGGAGIAEYGLRHRTPTTGNSCWQGSVALSPGNPLGIQNSCNQPCGGLSGPAPLDNAPGRKGLSRVDRSLPCSRDGSDWSRSNRRHALLGDRAEKHLAVSLPPRKVTSEMIDLCGGIPETDPALTGSNGTFPDNNALLDRSASPAFRSRRSHRTHRNVKSSA